LILTNKESTLQIYKNGKTYRPKQAEVESINFLLKKTIKNIYIHNADNDGEKKKDQGLDIFGKTFIAIPLLAKNQHFGIVILANDEEHFFSPLEINISQQAGPQITLAIIKIRSLDEAQQISKDLRDLRETIVDISSELEFRKLMDTILERAVNLLNAEGGEFYIYDEDSEELETVTSLNLDKDYRGMRIKIGQGAAGKAIQLKKIINLKDYSAWNNRINAYDKSKIKASISTPLIVGDRILGCIGVFNYTSGILFRQNEQHLLSIFAQHASIAIDNAMLFQKIQEMARVDVVTGLLNRRALFEIGEYEVARSIRLDRPIAMAMIDLDNYKEVNDQYSHIVGDKVLKEVARIFRENVRNIDIIGRYGGDECIIIMPETDVDNAILAIERIRNVLESTPIKVEDHEFHITACFGISSYNHNPPSLGSIIEEADSAMYAAKMAGRNCIRIYQRL
jgi:diguanylate cyclase (GGDEF)-like protein